MSFVGTVGEKLMYLRANPPHTNDSLQLRTIEAIDGFATNSWFCIRC